MRIATSLLGASLIIFYSVMGALLMNDWAVAAASGLSIEATVAEMTAANQTYSVIPGIVFASIGGVLAATWMAMALSPRLNLSGWGKLSLWAAIITLGAPAFFFASFGNMNSVGDTFYDWNAEAAFALEMPLYLASGIALIVSISACILAAFRASSRRISSLAE